MGTFAGARTARCDSWMRAFPGLRDAATAPHAPGAFAETVEQLDLATVVKVSEAVSGEIVLEKLIDMLMRTAIEHAGAERGLLILPRGDDHRIEAEVTTRGNEVTVELRQASVTAADLPESVFRYALRTKESVVLHDATGQSPFSADDYIRKHHARSVLCLPILKQARLLGMLYLENNLTAHVFTPARMAILRLLASEAAISMENARLYRDLAEREARIRRLVDANIIGIIICDVEGQILEANDAFLRIVGYDRKDLVSQRVRWTDMTPPEWRERDQQQLVPELKTTGSLQPFEKEFFRKDGSRVPVLIGVANFEDGHQGVAFVLDLTERKQRRGRAARAADGPGAREPPGNDGTACRLDRARGQSADRCGTQQRQCRVALPRERSPGPGGGQGGDRVRGERHLSCGRHHQRHPRSSEEGAAPQVGSRPERGHRGSDCTRAR